jgi:hypothetical protein
VDFLSWMPQKIHDKWVALAVCRVKNRLIGDFWVAMREAQQTARGVWYGNHSAHGY